MIAFVFVLLLSGIAYVVICLVVETSRKELKVRAELLAADRKLAAEHRKVRRAMNDAAGQSWRNLAE